MKNYSRQREAILEVLRSADTHPTAREVFERVRKICPNISLATVYRNLSQLSQDGTVLNLSVSDGNEHFDGDTSPHLHLVCKKCGAICDVPIEGNPFFDRAENKGFSPQTGVYVIYGLCADCRQKSEKEND